MRLTTVITLFLVMQALLVSAQTKTPMRISDIRQQNGWYRVYDQNSKQQYTLSVSQGELVGFSADIFILRKNGWYYLHKADGKQYKTISVTAVGEIRNVAGVTFTAYRGGWIYTYNANGKRIAARSTKD